MVIRPGMRDGKILISGLDLTSWGTNLHLNKESKMKSFSIEKNEETSWIENHQVKSSVTKA
jgi:hypothetical protein